MTWNPGQNDAIHFQKHEAPRRPLRQQTPLIHNMQLGKVETLVTRFVAPKAKTLADHFHPASEVHLAQIIAMRQTMVKRSSEEDEIYLRWRYDFSDHDEGRDKNAALEKNRIWVFSKGQEVLGFLGVEATTLCYHSREIRAIKVMDLMVKPEVDGRGLGVWMNLKLQSFGLPIIALGSNHNSVGIMSKLFYRMPNQQVYKSILNSSHYFSRRIQNTLLASVFSNFYNLGIPLLLGSKSIKVGGRGIVMRTVSRFDAKHDDNLEKMQCQGIQFKRDASYLNWRFFDIPSDRVEVLGLWEGQSLTGYLALGLRPSGKAKHERLSAFLLDWAALPEKTYQQALLTALLDCQKRLRREGFESLSAFASSKTHDTFLRRACLHRRRDDSKTVSVFVNDPFSFQVLCQSTEWSLTGADTDYA